MKTKNLIIYHGSVSIIENPKYEAGKLNNDYGRGFYCTESLELAKEWAVSDSKDGFANKYSLDLSNLKILDLSKNATVLHWITILLQNRVFNLKSDISKMGKKYLIEHFNIQIDQYDIIKGYRADDSYFAYAENFLNNTISVKRLSEALRLGDLGEQIVLISKKAFQQITFLGYEKADSKTYYLLRLERNENARKEFLMNRRGTPSIDDLYLNDIMKGIDPNDPRIQ